MLSLRSTRYAPPGGVWFYEVDGVRIESQSSFTDLESKVVYHYETIGLAIPLDLRLLIEDFMCKHLPDGNCVGEGARIPGSVSPSFFEIIKNLGKLRGVPYTDARAAEMRATTCRACPNNNFAACHSCNGLQENTLNAVGGRRVLNLPYLGVCLLYALPTYGLVWVRDLPETAGLPDNCWAKGRST